MVDRILVNRYLLDNLKRRELGIRYRLAAPRIKEGGTARLGVLGPALRRWPLGSVRAHHLPIGAKPQRRCQADQQFAVKMLVSGATKFDRNNPVTIEIGTAYGMTSDQIDAFFHRAALL